jgi:hypothetical protein
LNRKTITNLRRGGRQKVTVEHVHVHPGAQAVVGNVTTGGIEKKGQQAYAISDGRDDGTLWREDSKRKTVPLLVSDGQTAMSDARRRAPGTGFHAASGTEIIGTADAPSRQ